MDLQKLAKEYHRLQEYKYYFGIENGEIIELQFMDHDFYHLLGFQKFKEDVSIIKMIEDKAYYKDKFYKNVLHGKITFDEIKYDIKNIDSYFTNGQLVNFCEAKANDKVKLVLNNRFPYFSYENVRKLMNSNLIVLYDKSKADTWNKIDAEKIFFQLLSKENKNLNLFVKQTNDIQGDCPVSFFLEMQKDAYIKTNTSSVNKEQRKAEIVFRAVIKRGTKQIESFNVDWRKVRFSYSRNVLSDFKAQKSLAEYLPKGMLILHSDVEEKYEEILEQRNNILEKLKEIELQLEIKILYNEYLTESDETRQLEIALLALDKYEINFEELDHNDSLTEEIERIYVQTKNELSKHNRVVKKFEKMIPRLQRLEREEIIYVYGKFIENLETYEDEFFMQLIDKHNIMKRNVVPNIIKDYYAEYLENKK